MALRYYSPTPLKCGQISSIQGQEASHLIKTMRVKAGQELPFFDGSGSEFRTKVLQVHRSDLEIEVLQESKPDIELPVRITLGCAVPKGDRSRFLVEKLTELGISTLIPMEFDHSEKHSSRNNLKKAQHWTIEAAKQCGRTKLLQIQPSETWQNFQNKTENYSHKMIALAPSDLEDQTLPDSDAKSKQNLRATDVLILVGPEGGFTSGEVRQAIKLGFQPAHLGRAVLRIETAAIALASIAINSLK